VTRVLQEVAPSAIAVICLNAAQAQAITSALSDLAKMHLRCALNPKPETRNPKPETLSHLAQMHLRCAPACCSPQQFYRRMERRKVAI
jgi:hypothetical protein